MGGERNTDGEIPHDGYPDAHWDRPRPSTETNPWASSAPPPTQNNNSNSNNAVGVPPILRPGNANRHDITQEQDAWGQESRQFQPESQSSIPQTHGAPSTSQDSETNPFFKKLAEEREAGSRHPTPPTPPTDAFSQLAVDEPKTNPWDTTDIIGTGTRATGDGGFGRPTAHWSMDLSQQPNPAAPPQPEEIRVSGGGEELLIWGNESAQDGKPGHDAKGPVSNQLAVEPTPWDDGLGGTIPQINPPAPPSKEGEVKQDWNLIDLGPGTEAASSQDGSRTTAADVTPPTPPSQSAVAARPSPLQESASHEPCAEEAGPPLPTRVLTREATEMYHIKSINWYDHRTRQNPRTSPILIQNANGPCPLVALINALVLTTPADAEETPLTHVLRSREQISISLLLEAVVEELVSFPRKAGEALPDMTDLYSFLKGLDTGMNVNPRFVPSEQLADSMNRTWLGRLSPSERENCIPGGFEETKEMALYATFSIPLVHGWLPSTSDIVHSSMKTRAESYEEAQHILFMEDELQEKLESPTSTGLTPEEQEMYQDIMIIKDFLEESPTQLTSWGLEVLRNAMPAGAVAILFRNDHFSTLYKHPETMSLLTLVSDAGYARHAEVVWESLANVNGEAEFYSGDFRLVGGAEVGQQGPQSAAVADNEGGWTTVQNRRSCGPAERPQLSPNIEQEDQDFAMALQLQEEEDERHRRAEEARRQEQRRLSEQYIEQQGRRPQVFSQRPASNTSRPAGMRRPGAGGATQQVVRPLVPPAGAPVARPVGRPAVHRPTDTGGDDAPPSYDESANDEPFRPPPGHPSHPSSVAGAPSPQPQAQSLPQSQPQQQPSYQGPGTVGAAGGQRVPRRPVPPSAISSSSLGGGSVQRDRDCVVM